MKLSIVTPSLNQGRFLGEAMDSVLGQGYPDLEYVVVDGGSTDGSVAVIEKYAERLAWWVSEKDDGHYDAVNRGFEKTTGEIMGWLNSDDMYLPWTFSVVSEIFQNLPEVEWLTTLYPMSRDERGRVVRCSRRGPYCRKAFLGGDNFPAHGRLASGWIQQEATFWRRSLWERAGGGLDTSFPLAADFELWARFFEKAVLHAADVPLAGIRRHGGQRSARAIGEYQAEALRALRKAGGKPRGVFASKLATALRRLTPNRLKPVAGRLGLLATGKVCAYDFAARRWQITER